MACCFFKKNRLYNANSIGNQKHFITVESSVTSLQPLSLYFKVVAVTVKRHFSEKGPFRAPWPGKHLD